MLTSYDNIIILCCHTVVDRCFCILYYMRDIINVPAVDITRRYYYVDRVAVTTPILY